MAKRMGLVDLTNFPATQRLLDRLGAAFVDEVGEKVAKEVTPWIAGKMRSAASGSGVYGSRVASTIQATGGSAAPAIQAGGGRVVASRGATAGDLLFGANWGAGQSRRKTYAMRTRGGARTVSRRVTRQFPPWRGGGSNDAFIYSVVRANRAELEKRWGDAIDEAVLAWDD